MFAVSKLTPVIELQLILCSLKCSHHYLRRKSIFGIPTKDMLKKYCSIS